MDVNSILEKHGKWIRGEEGGERADLRGADLRGANLRGADLHWAELSKANLREADLRWSRLRGANLRGADLSKVNLREADLSWSRLSGANLREADLREANLLGADLSGADLLGADLSGADLIWADLPVGVRIISVSGVGSARRMTTFRADTDEVWCGCFKGTLREFAEKIDVAHKDNSVHLADYRAVVAMLEAFRTNTKPAKRGRGEG